jgi:phosphoenolpyruvate phosphomutase
MGSRVIAGGAAAALRDLLQRGQRPACALGAVNALAATVAVEAGVDALWLSGLELSASRGLPDANVIGVGDLVNALSSISAITALPVLVDIDNAAGTLASARRYARELALAGAAAVCLEDSTYPKCNSFSAHRSQGLADIDLVRAQLVEMRQTVGDSLVIVARTEALVCGLSVADAVARARRYVAAGADAVLIHSKDPSGRQALDVAHTWDPATPLLVVPTAFPTLSREQLGNAGFRLCIYANQLSRVALAAMRKAAKVFANNGTFSDEVDMASVGDLLRVGEPEAVAFI